MSILSDIEIEQLCVAPETILDADGYKSALETRAHITPTRDSEGYFKRIRQEFTRPTTQKERAAFEPMIFPYIKDSIRVNDKGEKILSYGQSSYGYDVRVADEFKIFTNVNSVVVDPKNFDSNSFVDFKGNVCIIPPNSFVLARTLERFKLPRDIVGICVGKSSIARCGINCLVTPLEPGWEGYLTLEFANTTPLPAKLYANEGGLQIQFFRGNPCRTSYADRAGKYQGQYSEITLPKV